jgi:DNA invertase Pin-like site-specific DNA recombinase
MRYYGGKMFIRAYLRASTEDQFADRAKEMLEQFVQQRGHKIASYYLENISGTKLDRPELGRLLMDSHHNDILLVEQIDRLTRLSNSDWMTLKKQIEKHELRIVSLDVPTSWQALSDKDPSQADPITRAVITAINNMLIDLMAAMSHKDWLSRRQRQNRGLNGLIH